MLLKGERPENVKLYSLIRYMLKPRGVSIDELQEEFISLERLSSDALIHFRR